MSRKAAALAFIAAAVTVGACFDWTVGVMLADGGGDARPSDGGDLDGGADASGDAVADADASDAPALTFACPSNPAGAATDGGRLKCVRPTQECCLVNAASIYECQPLASGCDPHFACTRSKECPALQPYCCYGPLSGIALGSATCEKTCAAGGVLCEVAGECTDLDAGSACKPSTASNPPPDPLYVCQP